MRKNPKKFIQLNNNLNKVMIWLYQAQPQHHLQVQLSQLQSQAQHKLLCNPQLNQLCQP